MRGVRPSCFTDCLHKPCFCLATNGGAPGLRVSHAPGGLHQQAPFRGAKLDGFGGKQQTASRSVCSRCGAPFDRPYLTQRDSPCLPRNTRTRPNVARSQGVEDCVSSRVGFHGNADLPPSMTTCGFAHFPSGIISFPTSSAASIRQSNELSKCSFTDPDSVCIPAQHHGSPTHWDGPHRFLFRRRLTTLASTLSLSRSARKVPVYGTSQLSPREFRRQSLKLQRQGELFGYFAGLPYVSWRSLLRVLHLLVAKPFFRGQDLLALPVVCKRLGVSDFRVVDRLLAGAVVRPSMNFASPFSDSSDGQVTEEDRSCLRTGDTSTKPDPAYRAHAPTAARVALKKRPPFSLFVASLDDWPVQHHPHHMHAVQRLLAAICANLHNYTTPDLLLLFDGLTALGTPQGGDGSEVALPKLKRGLGQMPVEALEEFEVTLGLLLLQIRARLREGESAGGTGKDGESFFSSRNVLKAYEIVSRVAGVPPECWTSPFFAGARVRANAGAGGVLPSSAEPTEGQLTVQKHALAKFLNTSPAARVGEAGETNDDFTCSPVHAVEDLLCLLGSRILADDVANEALLANVACSVSTVALDTISLVQASSIVAGSHSRRSPAYLALAYMRLAERQPPRPTAAAMAQEILKRVASMKLPVEKDGKTHWYTVRELLPSSGIPTEARHALITALSLAPPSVLPAFAGAVWRELEAGFKGERQSGVAASNDHRTGSFRELSSPPSDGPSALSEATLVAALPLFSRCAILAVTIPRECRATREELECTTGFSSQGRARGRELHSVDNVSSPHSDAKGVMCTRAPNGLLWLRRLSSVVELALKRQMERMQRDCSSTRDTSSPGEPQTLPTGRVCGAGWREDPVPGLESAVEVFCAADVGARLTKSLKSSLFWSRRSWKRSSLSGQRRQGKALRWPAAWLSATSLERGVVKKRLLDSFQWKRETMFRILTSVHRRFVLSRRLAELQLRQATFEVGPLLSDASLARLTALTSPTRSSEGEIVSCSSGQPHTSDPGVSVGERRRNKRSQLFRSERQSIHDWLVPHVIRVCPLHMSALYFQLLVNELATSCWRRACGSVDARGYGGKAASVRSESRCVKESREADSSGSDGARATWQGAQSGERDSAKRSALSRTNAPVGDRLLLHALRIADHVRQRLDGIRRQLARQCRLSAAQQERVLISLPQFQQYNKELVLRDRHLDFSPFGKLFNLREPACGVRTSRDVLALVKVTNQHVSRAMASVATLQSSVQLWLSELQEVGRTGRGAGRVGSANDGDEAHLSGEKGAPSRGRSRGSPEMERVDIRNGLRNYCRELQEVTEALARSSRRCLYTAIVQIPLRRKTWVGPCQGEVEWATQQALAIMEADGARDRSGVSRLLEATENEEGRLPSAAGTGAVQTLASELAAGSGLRGCKEKPNGVGAADGKSTLSKMAEMNAIIQCMQPERGIVAWELRNPPRVVTARGRGLRGHHQGRWREGVEHRLGENAHDRSGGIPGMFARLRILKKSDAAESRRENSNEEHAGHTLQSSVNGESETITATVAGKKERFMVQVGAT
ncbi:hypothetical protein TGCAST_297890 [Toxoplasma gondii CAST]|uniref:Uncharacterized protein n=1 Tax=Toxoplasma gondii CAST TaxID=943122 RepID=A0A3R7Z134_TOXGO|nr:hypothetical protein TGCAST_297890 [Toxoplasma gondii CAST]